VSLIKAYRGEFGLKIRFHVPKVYAMGRGHTIEIEDGEEALYPLADSWVVVPRAKDDDRHGSPALRHQRLPEQRFQPVPHVPQNVLPPDVVICPRRRNYVAPKNWPHWHTLVAQLQTAGVRVFAAGSPDASFTDLPCTAAWHHVRYLDASIAAIRAAKLVIAPCSGLAHLAVLCGAPLLMFSHHGRSSPGPLYNSGGHFVSHEGRRLPLREYYQDANHMGSLIEVIDAWDDPATVAAYAISYLKTRTQ
jgi:hypothetical protein